MKKNKYGKVLSALLVSSIMLGGLPVAEIQATGPEDAFTNTDIPITDLTLETVLEDIQGLQDIIQGLDGNYDDADALKMLTDRYDLVLEDISYLETQEEKDVAGASLASIRYFIDNVINQGGLDDVTTTIDSELTSIRELVTEYSKNHTYATLEQAFEKMDAVQILVDNLEDEAVRTEHITSMKSISTSIIQELTLDIRKDDAAVIVEYEDVLTNALKTIAHYEPTAVKDVLDMQYIYVDSDITDETKKAEYVASIDRVKEFYETQEQAPEEEATMTIEEEIAAIDALLAEIDVKLTAKNFRALQSAVDAFEANVALIEDVAERELNEAKVATYRTNISDIIEAEKAKGLKIGLHQLAVGVGQKLVLRSTSILPVTWTSSDPAVVTVDEHGLAEAVGVGEAEVIATIAGTDISDSIGLKVVNLNLPEEGQDETVTPEEGEGEVVDPEAGGDETVAPEEGEGEVVDPEAGGDETVAPEEGEGEVVDPEAGGDETVAPEEGEGEVVDPEAGGDETVAPEEGKGETVDPEAGGDETPTPDAGAGNDVTPDTPITNVDPDNNEVPSDTGVTPKGDGDENSGPSDMQPGYVEFSEPGDDVDPDAEVGPEATAVALDEDGKQVYESTGSAGVGLGFFGSISALGAALFKRKRN